jgi:acyl-CoA hydrolase
VLPAQTVSTPELAPKPFWILTVTPAKLGDVVEIGMEMVAIGTTSITFKCEVRNKRTKESILKMDKIVFVRVDENGHPTRHKLAGKTIEEL